MFLISSFLTTGKNQEGTCSINFLNKFLIKGFTWLVGILVVIPTIEWLHYLAAFSFCILNATHGLHIFVVFIVISKERRSILEKKIKYKLKNFKMALQNR